MDPGDHRGVRRSPGQGRAAALIAALTGTGLALASGPAQGAETLHVYTTLDPAEAGLYIGAFERSAGVPVRWVRLSSGELLVRVRAERARPQASVWFGGSSAELMFAANDGLLERHHPATFDQLPPSARDPDWRWVGLSESLVGFASNPRVLAEQGAAVPRAWRDLLRPELRGLVSMAYAYTSGTAYTIVAALAQLFGEAEAVEYWRALDRNVHHYNRSGSACVTQTGLGEVGVCVAFTNDIVTKGIDRGYGLVMTFPEEGAAAEVDGMALLAGAPEAALGRRFLDFMLDLPAQRLVARKHRIPVRPDAGPGDGIPAANAVRRIAFDPARAASTRTRVVELWREATGQ